VKARQNRDDPKARKTICVVLQRTKSHEGRLEKADYDAAVTVINKVHCLVKWQLGLSVVSSVVAAVGLLYVG
jgi:hypothetical protein